MIRIPRRNFILVAFATVTIIFFLVGFRGGHDKAVNIRFRADIHEGPGASRKLSNVEQTEQFPSNPAPKVPPLTTTTTTTTTTTPKKAKQKSADQLTHNQIFAREESDSHQLPINSKVVTDEEREAVLDAEVVDIPRVEPKPKDRQTSARDLAKTKAAQGGKKLPPPPIESSLFSFTALRYSKNSTKNPFRYGAVLAATRLAMEHSPHSVDISALKPPKKISDEVLNSNILTSDNRIRFESAPQYRLGDRIPPQGAKHILVVTSWRSGSTFLGDLLNHYPGTFYTFEPMHYHSRTYKTETSNDDKNNEDIMNVMARDAIQMMRELYKCNFNESTLGYLSHVSHPANQFLFKHNFRIWNVCSSLLPGSTACFMPEFYRTVCPLFPIRLMKTVRLRVPFIHTLLKDPEIGPNMKIVMLARDPRGTMTSRSVMTWCENPHCSNPEVSCTDLENDLEAASDLKLRFPDQIYLVRYEDLSLTPFETTDGILKFLGLKPNQLIEKFLETHTNTKRKTEITDGANAETEEDTTKKPDDVDPTGSRKGTKIKPHNEEDTTKKPKKENPYGTNRDSKVTAFAWKSKIEFKYLLEVQHICRRPMEKLGYGFIETEAEKEDPNFTVLVKPAEDVSLFRIGNQT